jgi:hypothetical protein
MGRLTRRCSPPPGDQERKAIYDELRKAMRKPPDDAFFARVAEMAQRLATIRAMGQSASAPVITADDMIWGRDLALWSAERMLAETAEHISENENQANTKRVLGLIKRNSPCPHRTLLQRLGGIIKAAELGGIITNLEDAGLITTTVGERPAQGGRPPKVYVA